MRDQNRISVRWCLAGAVFLLGFSSPGAHAGPPADSLFALVISAGGGYSLYAGDINPPQDIPSVVHRGGFSGSIRVMWYPDHLLRVGIESGWTRFFSYGLQTNPRSNLNLSAIPLLLVFSMPVGEHFNVFVGAGGYVVSSDLDYKTIVRVDEFSQGWMLAGSYLFPVSRSLGIAAELKLFNASQFKDVSLTLQVHLVSRVLEW
jgi:hypothetical protein